MIFLVLKFSSFGLAINPPQSHEELYRDLPAGDLPYRDLPAGGAGINGGAEINGTSPVALNDNTVVTNSNNVGNASSTQARATGLDHMRSFLTSLSNGQSSDNNEPSPSTDRPSTSRPSFSSTSSDESFELMSAEEARRILAELNDCVQDVLNERGEGRYRPYNNIPNGSDSSESDLEGDHELYSRNGSTGNIDTIENAPEGDELDSSDIFSSTSEDEFSDVDDFTGTSGWMLGTRNDKGNARGDTRREANRRDVNGSSSANGRESDSSIFIESPETRKRIEELMGDVFRNNRGAQGEKNDEMRD